MEEIKKMKKLIDEKGKIFGIINIVDLTVITLIILVLGVVTYRVATSFSDSSSSSSKNNIEEEQDIYITVYANSVAPEVVDVLKIGDSLVANGKFTDAEIIDIIVTPAAYISGDSEGNLIYGEHPMWVDVVATIKDSIILTDSPILRVGEQEARVNYNFYLKTQEFEVLSKIRKLDIVEKDSEFTIEPIMYDRIEQERSEENLFDVNNPNNIRVKDDEDDEDK